MLVKFLAWSEPFASKICWPWMKHQSCPQDMWKNCLEMPPWMLSVVQPIRRAIASGVKLLSMTQSGGRWHSMIKSGHSEPAPTSAPWKMNGKWSGNNFLLGSSSLANYRGYLNCFFFPTHLLTTHKQVVSKHSAAHHEGGMVSGQEKDFCWIPVP